jgi:hypothetical protein
VAPDYPAVLGALIVLNWPVYILIGRIAFKDTADLKESLWYLLMPDIVSLIRGKWWDDQWAQGKLILTFLVCGLIVSAEYEAACRLIAYYSS